MCRTGISSFKRSLAEIKIIRGHDPINSIHFGNIIWDILSHRPPSVIEWLIIEAALLQPGGRTICTFYTKEYRISHLTQSLTCFTAVAQNWSGLSTTKVCSPGNVKTQNPVFFRNMLVLIKPTLTAAFNSQKKILIKFREAHCKLAEQASICQLSGALLPLTGLARAE